MKMKWGLKQKVSDCLQCEHPRPTGLDLLLTVVKQELGIQKPHKMKLGAGVRPGPPV